MVPEDQHIMLRWIVFGTEVDVVGQRERRTHVGIGLGRGDDPFLRGFGHIQDGVAVAGDVGEPTPCTAGIGDDVGLAIVHTRGFDLGQVIGGSGADTFQVGTDHVDHDGVVLRRGFLQHVRNGQGRQGRIIDLTHAGQCPGEFCRFPGGRQFF